jgi:hypothetical protein
MHIADVYNLSDILTTCVHDQLIPKIKHFDSDCEFLDHHTTLRLIFLLTFVRLS